MVQEITGLPPAVAAARVARDGGVRPGRLSDLAITGLTDPTP